MKRILLPIDFSEAAANTLKFAHQLAIDKGMELSLLYCYPREEYNRKYDFPDTDYDEGIRIMLSDFYHKNIIDQKGAPQFLAKAGPVLEQVIQLSINYQLILLNYKKSGSSINRWFGGRSTAIASLAFCPVVMVPISAKYSSWDCIWHIKRKDNEDKIIDPWIKKLAINPLAIQPKFLEQQTFISLIWKSMVAYIKKPQETIRQTIIEAAPSQEINLILLVSHQKDSFQRFIQNEAIQILFEFGIPVMIFQAKTSDLD